jgi:hypothetical protein
MSSPAKAAMPILIKVLISSPSFVQPVH